MYRSLGHGSIVGILAVMTLLPVAEILARLSDRGGIAGSIPAVQHLTLWLTLGGAVLAACSQRLLTMSTAAFLPGRIRPGIHAFTSIVGAGVSTWLAFASLDLIRATRDAGDRVAWGVPTWFVLLALPISFAAIAIVLVLRAAAPRSTILSFCSIALAVPLFARSAELTPYILLTVILVALALGMPIFAGLGGCALTLFWASGSPVSSVAFDFYRLAAHPILPAIPLFTFSGYVLAEGQAGRRLLNAFTAWFGWIPGGLAVVVALVLAFFTPLTGASGVTILSMGGMFLPMLTKAGYPDKTAMGLVTVSGSIGLLLPPSLPVILYAILAHQPVDRMFQAALIPAGLLIGVVAVWGAWRGWRAGAVRTPFSLREALSAAWAAKFEALLPVIVLVGYFGGFATLVEVAAVTILYAVIVEVFIYRSGTLRDLARQAVESATLAGGFLLVLGVALGFTNYLIQAEVPMRALELLRANVQSPAVFLLGLNLFLLIAGSLMDIYSAVFVIVPLITPIGAAYGIDPIHLGLIFLANMELGYLMPPMGENLFLSSYRFQQPLTRVYASTLPFLVILGAAVLVITYVPGLSLSLLR